MREVVEGILVDKGDQADHQGHATIPALNVGVAFLLEKGKWFVHKTD